MNIVLSVTRFRRPLILAALCGLSVTSGALPAAGVRVFRCNDGAGGVEFRQTRCPSGGEVALQVRNPLMGWVKPVAGARPATPVDPEPREIGQEPEPGGARSADGKVDRRRCWTAGTRLERLQRQLRKGYKASQSERLHQQQREQEAYIQRFCR